MKIPFQLKSQLLVLFCFFAIVPIVQIANAQSVNFTYSNLPIIVINTHGQTILDDYRIVADMGIIWHQDGSRNLMTDPFNDYDGKIAIELRGSSSQMFPKKQYALETQDTLGENLNVSLLGLPQENDWILYAPYSDKSLLRNVLAYKLSNDIGRYTSRTRFCELVLNGDYRGIYVLMEKIKRDRNRIDISRLNPDEISGDDLTGGYIIKIDKWAGENIGGWYSPFAPYPGSSSGIFYQYHYPKPDEIVYEQELYIQGVINSYESTMFGSGFADTVNGYHKYIDVGSFIDFFILNEIGKNVDGYRLSSFFYKDRDSIDSILYTGPIWDFNLAFGNADYYEGGSTSGWQVEINHQTQFVQWNDQFKVPFWWEKLLMDEAFSNRLHCRWLELRDHEFTLMRMHAYIDSIVLVLDEAQQRNFQRWPILGTYVWPNLQVFDTYVEEVSYLKNWIHTRLLWMDTNMFGSCASYTHKDTDITPRVFSLAQNYPNPFNPLTKIKFSLPRGDKVKIELYNTIGQRVEILLNQPMKAGHHEIEFNAQNLSSGIYFYRIEAGEFQDVKKMVLLR